MRAGSMKMPSSTRLRLSSIANKLTNTRPVRTLILKNRVFGNGTNLGSGGIRGLICREVHMTAITLRPLYPSDIPRGTEHAVASTKDSDSLGNL
jgi:hypothetical protein